MSTLIQELDQPDLLSDNGRRSYAFGLVPPPKSSTPGIAPEDVTLRNITPGRPHRRARCHQCGTQSSLGRCQQSRRHHDPVTRHASAADAHDWHSFRLPAFQLSRLGIQGADPAGHHDTISSPRGESETSALVPNTALLQK